MMPKAIDVKIHEALQNVLKRLGVETLRGRVTPTEVVNGNPKYFTKPIKKAQHGR